MDGAEEGPELGEVFEARDALKAPKPSEMEPRGRAPFQGTLTACAQSGPTQRNSSCALTATSR